MKNGNQVTTKSPGTKKLPSMYRTKTRDELSVNEKKELRRKKKKYLFQMSERLEAIHEQRKLLREEKKKLQKMKTGEKIRQRREERRITAEAKAKANEEWLKKKFQLEELRLMREGRNEQST